MSIHGLSGYNVKTPSAPNKSRLYSSRPLKYAGYGLDGPGIESRWGARFSAPVQTGPEAHPASCTMVTGSFPGVNSCRGVTLTHHPPSSAVGLHVPRFGLDLFIPLNAELNPICYLLALLGAHYFLHVSRIRVKSLTFRLLMSYIYIWSTYS